LCLRLGTERRSGVSPMNDGDVERIQVNVRVDKQVKDAYDEKIIETFGTLRPYAGIELEREFRVFLDRGDIAALRAVVEDILTTFQNSNHKNKIREPQREESVSIGYRISEKLRHEMKSVSNEDYRSFGSLVEAIMYTYVTEGRFLQRVTEDLQHVLEHTETTRDDSLGAKGRRTQTIATVLEDRDQDAFDMADFEDAIESASGISASTYTKKEYLPRVLDELNYTWDPEQPDRFIEREAYSAPSIRDVTTKPYLLMNREDKRKAIKIAAYRSAKRQSPIFTIEEADTVLQGRPKRSTIKSLMRNIASSSPGYEYPPEKNVMKVSPKTVVDNPNQNLDVISVIHAAENWIDSAVDVVFQLSEDLDEEPDSFPHHVIDNKIAKSKYPELLAGDIGLERSPPDYVTQDDREKFSQQLASELEKPSVDIFSEDETTHIV